MLVKKALKKFIIPGDTGRKNNMPRVIYDSTKNSDMFYAVKTNVSDPFFLLTIGRQQYIFLDKREFGVFQKNNKNPNLELVMLEPILAKAKALKIGADLAQKLALFLFRKYKLLNKVIEVPASFSLDLADFLRTEGVKLIVRNPFYPERLLKTQEEVKAIKQSLQKTHSAFRLIEKILKASVIKNKKIKYQGKVLTSEFLKLAVESLLLKMGMVNSEGIIVSSGCQTAIPHHPGQGPILPHKTIICDIFPKSKATGYFADMTRTYVKGSPSDQILKLYETVRKAQAAGKKAVRPGARGGEVHQVCSQVFEREGYEVGDKGFIHGAGHGLGLDIHEGPNLKPGLETKLQIGNVVTMEPGLYYPKLGGVRIEDVLLVTKDGNENLTNYTNNFIL